MNAVMRRIDLFCKLAGPLFVSVLTIPSASFAAIFLAASNVLSLPFEYYFIHVVHKRFPDLAHKPAAPEHIRQPLIRQFLQWPKRTLSSWKIYYQSPLFAASLSLCILYFTVLSFGGTLKLNSTNERFHDCVSVTVRRLLHPPYRWSPRHCRSRRYRRHFPFLSCDPMDWACPLGYLVSFMADNLPRPCPGNSISLTEQAIARWLPRWVCVDQSSWSVGI